MRAAVCVFVCAGVCGKSREKPLWGSNQQNKTTVGGKKEKKGRIAVEITQIHGEGGGWGAC